MTRRILLILIFFALIAPIFAKAPAPRKHMNIIGTWRVITKSDLNTVSDIRFDSSIAFFGSYADTYTRFTYQFISPETLQLTDINQNTYLITIKKAYKIRLVLDGLFNVAGKIILEKVNNSTSRE